MGRRAAHRLTVAEVRSISKPGRHRDGAGLFLNVDATGAKRWGLIIETGGRRHELGGIGPYPQVTLAEAREKASEIRKRIRLADDPSAVIQKRRPARVATFRQAAQTVIEMHSPSWRNGKHAAQWTSTLEAYAYPLLANRSIAELSASDVIEMLSPIWLEKPETARRVLQRVNAIFEWAIVTGARAAANPCTGVRRVLPKQSSAVRHHPALPYVEVPGFVAALRTWPSAQIALACMEFLILTATRSGEVRFAQWPEIDWAAATWTLPAERTKAGRAHVVPLANQALHLLRSIRPSPPGSGLIFPGQKLGAPLSDMTLSMILRRMGLKAVPHGFRSAFRDWAAERTDFPREIAEAALAHAVPSKVEAAYRRTDYFDRRRELMALWGAFVSEASS
jgi:integrase